MVRVLLRRTMRNRLSATCAGPPVRAPVLAKVDPCAGQLQPAEVSRTSTPWCVHRRLRARYVFFPVRTTAAGIPRTSPIVATPPILRSAGTRRRFTRTRPFFNVVTALGGAGAALAVLAPAANSVRPHSPAATRRASLRDICGWLIPSVMAPVCAKTLNLAH
jgi:hypothetical protein